MKNSEKFIVDTLKKKAKEVKKLVLQISHQAKVGHIGSALSIADILTVLYFSTLRVRPKQPKWENRDRFILSKGHAAAALYSVLYLKGFFTKRVLTSYCQNKGSLGVHPEHEILGVEVTTGSLGHGLSVGVGMALNAKIDKKNYKTVVLISDAECNEGEIWQAAATANHYKLNNLITIIDNNKVQAFGKTKEVLDYEPLSQKWLSFGWDVIEVNGHNIESLFKIFSSGLAQTKPTVIIANTIRGKGVSFMEHKLEWHYFSTTKEQYIKALEEIEKS